MSGVPAADLALTDSAPRTVAQLQMLSAVLEQVKLFQNLNKGLLKSLCESAEIQIAVPGEVLCRQGEAAHSLFIVLKGAVVVSHSEDDEPEKPVAKLGPGASFGEAALLREQPRGATLTATTETTLFVLHHKEYDAIVTRAAQQHLEAKAAFLQSVPLFAKLSKHGLLKLAEFFSEEKHVRGDCIYREGDQASSVFLIISGEVEFVKSYSTSVREGVDIDSLIGPRNSSRETLPLRRLLSRKSRTWKQELRICVKGAREMFGEEEVIADGKRVAAAFCISLHVELLVISRADFVRRLQNPDMWTKISALNEKKQGWTTARLEDLNSTSRYDSASPCPTSQRPLRRSVSPFLEKKPETAEVPEDSNRVFATEVPAQSPMPRLRALCSDSSAPTLRRLAVPQRCLDKLLERRPREKLVGKESRTPPPRLGATTRPAKLCVDIRVGETEPTSVRTRQRVPIPALRLGILKNR